LRPKFHWAEKITKVL